MLVCLLGIACKFIQTPWPFVGMIAILLLGTRNQGFLAILLLTIGILFAALHFRVFQLFMELHKTTARMRLLAEDPNPIEDIDSGILLVASEQIHGSIFSHSVVLIYEHNEKGSKGVILNQQMKGAAEQQEACPDFQTFCIQLRSAKLSPLHFFGGPVGLPGEGASQEIVVFHSLPSVQGSREISLKNKFQGTEKLFVGGKIGDILKESSKSVEIQPLLIFHGISTWGPGQLDGEVRSGAWGYRMASPNDILHVAMQTEDGSWAENYEKANWFKE